MIASITSAVRGGAPFGGRYGARRLTFIAAAALVVAACGTDDAPGPLEAGPQGRIRFVNLITDPARNPVNAILEGVPFGVGLAYAQSTPSTLPAPSTANYSPVLTGDRSLVLQRTADPSVTVATLPVTIATGTDYTLFATGGTGGSAVTGFTTTDVNMPVTNGQVRIRVVNMSPTAGAVDVFITAPDANLATATPAATGLANRATFAGVTVAPGLYQVRTVPAGTAPAAREAAVNTTFTTPAAIAAGGSRTIIIADGATGGAPLRSFALTDQ